MSTSPLRIVCRAIVVGSTGVAGLLLGVGCSGDMMMTNTPAARQNEAKLYNDGQYAETVGAARVQIRRNPADYISHYYLASSLEKMGSHEQAITEYKTTLDLMARSLEGRDDAEFRQKILDELAGAIVKAGDRDVEANAIAKQKPTAENQFLLAKVNRLSGDPDAAVENYDHAMLLDRKNFPIAKEYGLYLEKLNLKNKARFALSRAYALNESDDQVAAALRRVGIVPGPSLKDESDLAKPVIPVGPLPDLTVPKQQPGDQRAETSPRD